MTIERAVAWALIHFLWQGALLGGVCWVALRALRITQARYAAACAVLGLMALSPVATVLLLMRESSGTRQITGALPGIRGMVLGQLEPVWTSALFEWLPLVWAAGAAVLLLRACGGWWLARQRSLRGLCGVPRVVVEQVEGMKERLGVRRVVDVFESAVAATPQVFGWLRPLLLLPASALAGLTPQQLEAVIAHELAHVRRHDYLVNLLQTFVESLLYYHPAVWWVSSRIRLERELCCDEAAVAACGDALLYSRALLQLEETRVQFAMAAGHRLKDRIGRILGMQERTTVIAPVVALSAALLLGSGMVLAQKEPSKPAAPTAPAASTAPAPAAMPDTLVVDGKTYKRKLPPPPPPPPTAPKAPAAAPLAPLDHSATSAELKALQKRMQELELKIEQLTMQKRELEQQAAATRDAERQIQSQKMELDRAVQEHKRQASSQEYAAQQAHVQAEAAAIQSKAAQQRELERRLKYADEKFAEPGKLGSETDRGKLYIRFGPPDEIESHPSEGREAWRYKGGSTYQFEKGRLVSSGMSI
jgi:GWxTD domain-containing protein